MRKPTSNTIRLYRVDTRGATDVSGWPSIKGRDVVPVSRTLLLDLSTLTHDDGSTLALDNIEGISWGHTLANGHRTLVLVADNNFSATQVTQFIALEVSPVPEPGSWALLLAGLGLLARRARRPGEAIA